MGYRMQALSDILGGLARPLLLAGVLIVILGLLSDHSGNGATGSSGFECKGFTSDPEVNRMLCRFHPARLWNTPVEELVPWLGGPTVEN